MNNEEKILNVLEQLTDTVSKLDTRMGRLEQTQEKIQEDIGDLKQTQEKMQEDIGDLKQTQEKMQEDIEIIKEDVQVTRGATNALVEWVEQAEVQVRIPFMKKAE